MAKQKTIAGFNASTVYIVVGVVLLLVAYYGYTEGWFEKEQTFIDNGDKLKLEREFALMKIGTETVADKSGNYNDESGMIAVQVDAEKFSNSTHTTFIIKTTKADGTVAEVANVSQLGILAKPTAPVTVPVTVEVGMNYVSGITNTNEILTSKISASAPVMKAADGKEFYYPVVLRNEKPAVYVNEMINSKSFTWVYSDTTQKADITLSLDWEGIDQMTSISDEVKIPIKFTNTNDSDITARIIKNAAL